MPAPRSHPTTATPRRRPGEVRDAILAHLKKLRGECSVSEIRAAVVGAIGEDVPASSVRSYLNLNTPGTFERTGRGLYRIARGA